MVGDVGGDSCGLAGTTTGLYQPAFVYHFRGGLVWFEGLEW